MIDHAELKAIQKNIDAQPGKFADIIEQTSMGVCITDAQGTFVAVNDNYTKLYKYSKAELVGKPFTLVVPTEHHGQLRQLHDQFMKYQTELTRNWTVKDKHGNDINIYADAFYTDKINGKPHKVTFVTPRAKG